MNKSVLPISEIVASIPVPKNEIPLKVNKGWDPNGASVVVALTSGRASPPIKTSWILRLGTSGYIFRGVTEPITGLCGWYVTSREAIDAALQYAENIYEFASFTDAAKWLDANGWL